jgi:hypothetical protein
VSRAEAENSATLSSAHADAEDLVQKVILLEDELAEEHWVWETCEREHKEGSHPSVDSGLRAMPRHHGPSSGRTPARGDVACSS